MVVEDDRGTGVGLGAEITAVTGTKLLCAKGLGPVAFVVVLAGDARSTRRGEASCMTTLTLVATPLLASGLGASTLLSPSN